MPDLYHTFGDDLVVSANGDLLTADSVDLSEQRIVRRLYTNPKDYIWQPDYGAGLPQKIGDPFTTDTIKAIVTGQMYLEESVVRSPAPTVTVDPFPNGMSIGIKYTESDTGFPVTLSLPVSPVAANG